MTTKPADPVTVELAEDVQRLVTPSFQLVGDETITITRREYESYQSKLRHAQGVNEPDE